MSFTVSLQQRIQQLKKAQEDVPRVLAEVAKDATLRAIEAATDATPPTAGDFRGTNTRSGELKQHWTAKQSRRSRRIKWKQNCGTI